jgi:sulfite oxidase
MTETPLIVHEDEPLNAETPPEHLRDHITDPGSFYVRGHGPVPRIDSDRWELVVDGLVRTLLRLDLAALRSRFAAHTVEATLQCAGNRRADLMAVRDIPGEAPWGIGAISTARWTGARLRDVLDAAGLSEDALHVAFTAADVAPEADPPQSFGGSVDRAKALSDDVVLAWAMNDDPLPAVHGAPVRVVVPGYIGARSVKWVERITAQNAPSDNHFQQVAYRMLAPDQQPGRGVGTELTTTSVTSAITDPADGSELAAGATEIRGYAVAGHGEHITAVAVSVDGGTSWQNAVLDAESSPWAWRHWELTTDLASGEQTIIVRARDTGGGEQSSDAAEVWNPKGYMNTARHLITVQVR